MNLDSSPRSPIAGRRSSSRTVDTRLNDPSFGQVTGTHLPRNGTCCQVCSAVIRAPDSVVRGQAGLVNNRLPFPKSGPRSRANIRRSFCHVIFAPERFLLQDAALCSLRRRSSCALAATMMVERLIATAPMLMGRSTPQRTRRPPATGMATRL